MLASEEGLPSMGLFGHEELSKGAAQISYLLGKAWSLMFVCLTVLCPLIVSKEMRVRRRTSRAA